jgi:hypothetical protein
VAALAVCVLAALVLAWFSGRPASKDPPPEVDLPTPVRVTKRVLWFALLVASGFLPGRWGLHGRDYGVSMAAVLALTIEVDFLLDDAFGSVSETDDAQRMTPSAATNKRTSSSPGTIR